jgi:hypothetical protein
MGEASQEDIKNSNMLKKLAGEDLISFQFKGKTPFTEENTALCTVLTNSLPITNDKSMGFYRRWILLDFPNQFDGIKFDLISGIPEIEFNNLALKCLNTLKRLYGTKKFTNEGSFEERMTKYEERSNPVMKFIDEYCIEEAGVNITLREFANICNIYLKSKHLKMQTAIQIGRLLRNEGFIVGNRNIGEMAAVVILNLDFINKKIKELKDCVKDGTLKDDKDCAIGENYRNYPNYPIPKPVSIRKTISDLDSSNSSNSFLPNFNEKKDIIDVVTDKIIDT